MVLGLFRNFGVGLAVLAVVIFHSVMVKSPDLVVSEGEQLAKQYCSTCHQFPDPKILTKKSWNYLLTDMGFRLGIVDYSNLQGYHPVALFNMTTREQILQIGGLIPAKPLLSEEDWAAIRRFYAENAPAIPLPQPPKKALSPDLVHFQLKFPDYQPAAAVITMVRIDSVHGRIMIGNQTDQTFTLLDQQLRKINSYQGYDLLVDAQTYHDGLYLMSIGDLMGQYIGVANGFVQWSPGQFENLAEPTLVLDQLHRPADMEFADLDGDGREELIVSNFGDVTGNVSLYSRQGSSYVFLKELINIPGAIKSQAHDFNNDGLMDIAVLMGDARENVSLFLNQGKFSFERKIVVETHPAYGHTYFELQDFNDDGYMDLLVVNGDTDADPFNTLKNYHGIRIYLNDQKDNFTLGYFYPMYGAHFAKAYDFDEDGDLDIAASAFFPDFSQDQPEQFVYLENKGGLKFNPYTHADTFNGRWMTLDIGDFDQDGDADIVLGSGYLPLGMSIEFPEKLNAMRTSGKALLVLENTIN